MSRIGKKPVTVPSNVTATIENGQLSVKGPKGTLAMALRAASAWAASKVKMSLRYWSPTSGPWRFTVVGSWFFKNTTSSCAYVT